MAKTKMGRKRSAGEHDVAEPQACGCIGVEEARGDDMLVRVDMLLHQSVFLRNIPVLSKSNRTGDALAVSTTVGRRYRE